MIEIVGAFGGVELGEGVGYCADAVLMFFGKAGSVSQRQPAMRPSSSPANPDLLVMKRWFLRISEDEIDAAVLHLIEQHGPDGARDEALRLADVGRRIGSAKNSAIFLRAAQRIAVEQGMTASETPPPRSWVKKLSVFVAEFGAPRVPLA
ncbi:hypothetical protein GGD83_004096 [Rhodoblastus sphagnicola]|uniref:hypothetical protein n=1 Tax=Rhodoblastus sphagnicola TaxID=333368 RepID=UPI000CEC3E75|nr:hypothetical protein [Rhodoblastus sphagnicola]MBB4200267.1 hypothetical protein [Rhodoblastus sphagnicola]